MCPTTYQNTVSKNVFDLRYSELEDKEKAQVNTFIKNWGRYPISKFPKLIKDAWSVVLKSSKVNEYVCSSYGCEKVATHKHRTGNQYYCNNCLMFMLSINKESSFIKLED